jgi:hypothetical protein
MGQLFKPGADAILRLVLFLGAGTIVFALLFMAGLPRSEYWTHVGIAANQPVPFSHAHHAGELGIDCRYCHTTVETQATAGIPPTYTCMTCHSQIWTGAPMLAPVRDSLAGNSPLHWVRLNRLPDYVYFNHSIHLAKGIGCSSCHGPVDQMQLTYRVSAFKMSFCVNCHRNPAESVRPPEQVWNMEWHPPADQAAIGKRLVARYHIRPAALLTDCSICHR